MSIMNVGVSGIRDVTDNLSAQNIHKAAKLALSDTKSRAFTEAIRLIRQRYNIKRKDLVTKGSGRPRIETSGRVTDDLKASITFHAGGISLIYFGAVKFVKTMRNGKSSSGVKYKIEKGKTKYLKQFIAPVRYGADRQGIHIGVFRRVPGRYANGNAKIKETLTNSPASWINKPEINTPLKKFIADTFAARLAYHKGRMR